MNKIVNIDMMWVEPAIISFDQTEVTLQGATDSAVISYTANTTFTMEQDDSTDWLQVDYDTTNNTVTVTTLSDVVDATQRVATLVFTGVNSKGYTKKYVLTIYQIP